ncbi:hypothetical protein BH24ACI4_BH24ACI4_12140 [soil metagenome]
MTRHATALALLLLLAACVPRMAPAPPAVTAPKFPDFVFPATPQNLGSPAAREQHEIAWQWLQAGDLRAAERNFAAALKGVASFYPAEVGLGYVELARKAHKESLLHFDRAVVANPRYAPALAGRAEALLATGDAAGALQSLEAALQADATLVSLRSRVEVLRFRTQQQNITNARKFADANRLAEAQAAYDAAIAASPESPFLHRELAEVERRAGNAAAALDHARKAAELDPDEPRTFIILGELHEAEGRIPEAIEAFTTAANLDADDELYDRIDRLRARAAFESMPEEYRVIETAPSVTRAQLAALIAVRLQDLLTGARPANPVITDGRAHWAADYILTATRAGVMEVYPNHTFQPDAIVRRADLAAAASRVLALIARRNPALGASWRNARRAFPDVGPRHLSYPAATLAVEAGVMTTMNDGRFELTRPVTGAEAAAAVTKLQELGARPVR